MVKEHDLRPLENWLRRVAPPVDYSEAHKNALRKRLFNKHARRAMFSPAWAWAGGAAVALVLMLVLFRDPSPPIGIMAKESEPSEELFLEGKTYSFTESTRIQLTDSTLLVGSDSTLTVETSYRLTNRNDRNHEMEGKDQTAGKTVVILRQGQVDIEVKKRNPSQSYRVRTPDVEIRVTGTRFSVEVVKGTTMD